MILGPGLANASKGHIVPTKFSIARWLATTMVCTMLSVEVQIDVYAQRTCVASTKLQYKCQAAAGGTASLAHYDATPSADILSIIVRHVAHLVHIHTLRMTSNGVSIVA